MLSVHQIQAKIPVLPESGGDCSGRMLRTECVMSVKSFAIPSEPLSHGWSRASDYARIVESRIVTDEAYAAARIELGCVYFIGEELGGDLIKIGWSRNPVARLRQLQTGNATPLKFIGCVAANRQIEPALHRLFSTASVSGEWFTDPEGSIRAWLNEMTFGQPIERCRFFKSGSGWVNWLWDDKAVLHRPVFSVPSK